MKTSPKNHHKKPRNAPGFISILTVISISTGLLLLLISMYENTVESQSAEKNSLLKNDYQQRENAFLRSLTTIIPNKAVICMQDDSANLESSLRWGAIMNEALVRSNSNSGVSVAVAETLSIGSRRSANSANSSFAGANVITPLAKVAYMGQSNSVSGEWQDVTVREWIDGYSVPGTWVPGYNVPGEYVSGYWYYNWRGRLRWRRGYWTPQTWVNGYTTPSTWVDGYWNETVESQWVLVPDENEDPGVSGNLVISGTNRAANSDFPPPLECSASVHLADSTYPIISLDKKYGTSATGWVADSVSDHPLYNRVAAPKQHFNYQNRGTLIAKHNWWAFELSLAKQNSSKTHMASRSKKYMISLYEIPSQLPINGASYTSLGAHSDGSEWSNINITGTVFAQKVKTEGGFTTNAISSRKGVELSEDTVVGGHAATDTGSNPFAGHAREIAQSKGDTFPISSSSDGGRVAFVPLNPGLDFYDRLTGTSASASSSNAVSPTSWNHYSRGSMQCVMNLDILDVVSSANQTPTSIRFNYMKNGALHSETFTKNDNWPNSDTEEGLLFPFHAMTTASNRPAIAIHIERISTYLTTNLAEPLSINHSLSINSDYLNNASISQPNFPSTDSDISVLLLDASDLTPFTKGLSLVTNMRLVIADDTNITEAPTPTGVILSAGEKFYPPLSMFAPEKRYGNTADAVPVEIEGQIGSLAKNNQNPVNIFDLKSGSSDDVVPGNISANLKPINHPAQLPPVNMMNWMVVIREIHPRFVRKQDDDSTQADGFTDS